MKKIIGFLVALVMCITFTSCAVTAEAHVDDMYDNVDISLVVTYGTPYYNADGLLLYYIYRDMFYYPYYYNHRYYLHRYSRPLPPSRLGRYKPVPRDFHVRNRPHVNHVTPPNKTTQHVDAHKPNVNNRPTPNINNRPMPNVNNRPTPNNSRQGIGRSVPRSGGDLNNRPSPPRSSTRGANGNFGGRRR